MHNLLTQPLLQTGSDDALTFPGVLAALARDEVDGFSALRPHQQPAWHMFLVQLAALALHKTATHKISEDEAEWVRILRGLTPGFENDEPWCLVVDDWTKPAFLQPPVPKGCDLKNLAASPDALDLLITSRNHDLKRSVARNGRPEDWVLALVSLQTGEGYGGAGNHGIARMNGGSSSRCMLTLAPIPPNAGKVMDPRPGAWFRRDVTALLETRAANLTKYGQLGYPATGGIGLTWIEPWPEGRQLQLDRLDIWFIEVCRRIRLNCCGESLSARKGTSKATRINAKHMKGALGDPYAPVHKIENKSFTLGGGDFDYKKLTVLYLSPQDWNKPLLAKPASFEKGGETLALLAMALARGNSKTEGFKSRILPIGGHVLEALGVRSKELHELAQAQMNEIKVFDKALGHALALTAAGGDPDKLNKEHYARARDARTRFDRAVDHIFFDHLWARFDAQERDNASLDMEKLDFATALLDRARRIFETTLPTILCAGIFRHRAEVRARRAFDGIIRKSFPELYSPHDGQETQDAAQTA